MRPISVAVVLLGASFMLSGCFEADFHYKTNVHSDGRIEREVKIEGRGADRFLPPQGPRWQIKTDVTKGGQVLLDDKVYHIEAKGSFANAAEMPSDFTWDNSNIEDDMTPETRQELIQEIGIPEPFKEHVGTSNKVDLKQTKSFWMITYVYSETFRNQWIMPLLIHDIKKHIVSEAQAKAEVVPENLDVLAEESLKGEYLNQFHFHSEVVLPGKIRSSNADQIIDGKAVWDFTLSDFEEKFSTYTLQVSSRAIRWGNVLACVVLGLTVLIVLFTSVKKSKKGS